MQWFRMYAEVLNDPKVQLLPPEIFKAWVNFLCLYCDKGVTSHVTVTVTAFASRVTIEVSQGHLDALVAAGLLEVIDGGYRPHGWDKRQYKSDTSAERTRRYRDRKRDVTVTPPDTDTDTENKVDKSTLSKTTKNVKQETNRGTRLEAYLEREWGHTSLPSGWEDWSIRELGWNEQRASRTFAEFRDYWKAQPASKGVKADWDATWRNWCRRANERTGNQTRNVGTGYLTAGQKHAAGVVLESAGWSAVASERRGQPVRSGKPE